MTKKEILTMGLFDKDSKKQEIDTETAHRLIDNAVAQRFDGATVYEATGVYKHLNGTTVKEPSIRIEIVYAEPGAVHELAQWLKENFNQESIMYEAVQEEVEFI